MPTRLVSVVVDSADPPALGRWWASALRWSVIHTSDDEVDIEPTAGHPGIELVFVPVAERKRGPNQIHLDLTSVGPGDRERLVDRLSSAGARPIQVGQPADADYVVLADPEDNEFCVLGPRPAYADCGALGAVVLNVDDPAAAVSFWTAAAGWSVHRQDDRLAGLRPVDATGPYLELMRSPGSGLVPRPKDRVHVDVAPFPGDDQAAETARLVAAGARTVDVGQLAPDGIRRPEVTWDVLVSPDGHELCVLSPR